MTAACPSSDRFTDAKSGALQRATSAARRSTSGSIHAPVETPTGMPGHADWIAATASSTYAGSSVSRPSASRGWTCRPAAPAATARAASAASSAALSGSAGCAPGARSPFRQALRRSPI